MPLRNAIEAGFPGVGLGDTAELESWRKEVNRPTYHLHKWWAQRLGTVVRAMIIGGLAAEDEDILSLVFEPTRFKGKIVYDPFMGSGTTIGEALKLGCRAIGRDINAVSHLAVKAALQPYSDKDILDTFSAIESDVSEKILRYYRREVAGRGMVDVLYNFWVMIAKCPHCHEDVDLFSSTIFARHTYPSKHPAARSVCPRCAAINTIAYNDAETECRACKLTYDPSRGAVARQQATCARCQMTFRIIDSIRNSAGPPGFRMYAKLVLLEDGSKEYLAIDDKDEALFKSAADELRSLADPYPVVPIQAGYNTNQVMNYNFTHWHQLCNPRQLVCISLLGSRISEISDSGLRDLFTCLFSGSLEFNNMLCSYKGEGTGAVRHMFAHHAAILTTSRGLSGQANAIAFVTIRDM